MVLKTSPISFIQDKVRNIGSALFYSQQDAVLKFPTTIVNALKVDEVGQIWFYLHRPGQHIHHFDHRFQAELDFYRKGKGYFLKVTGIAYIVNDPEEINQLMDWANEIDHVAMEKMILIKFRIQRVGYFAGIETSEKRALWFHSLKGWAMKLFFSDGQKYRPQYFLL